MCSCVVRGKGTHHVVIPPCINSFFLFLHLRLLCLIELIIDWSLGWRDRFVSPNKSGRAKGGGLKKQMEWERPLEIEEHPGMADQGVAQGFMLYKMVYYFRAEEPRTRSP